MEAIQEGLTWRQIQDLFNADQQFDMRIGNHRRKLKKWKRKRGETEDRTVVRLAVQMRHNGSAKTVYRKNLRNLDGNYLDEPANGKVVGNLNAVLAELGS